MRTPQIKNNPYTNELEMLVNDLVEYAKDRENITEDGMNKRLEYVQEAALTALYGEEFWVWYNAQV